MSEYTRNKANFIARMEAVRASFYNAINNMDLENVNVKDEMLAVADELSRAAANAKASLPSDYNAI